MPPVHHSRVSLLRCCLLLAGVGVLSACGEDGEAGAGNRTGAEQAAVVTTAVVALQRFSDRIDALGTVKARESVDITAKVSETVQQVHFESGDAVAAGAPLVTLSGQQQQAGLAAAEAAALEAQQLYARQESLASQQLIARAAFDAQRATRDSARAQVSEIQANLRDRVIRAPFAGVLGIRQVSPGALVTPGTVVATLDDIARVYVDFPVPEAQFANVVSGQRLVASGTAYPGRRFEGTVGLVDSRIDAATRAVTVRGEFANPERLLRPGMLLRVALERAPREALLVPEIAVVQVGQQTFVYRVKADQTVEQAAIRVGTRTDGKVEIVDGLAVGDRIVVDGTGKLRPGMAIVAAEADTASGRQAVPGLRPA
ncbi:MAG TPA: efflux RND transporter periplasmic adaptor subunit, partial [Luteimonas sp.]|nr:efflux RND transporter periplasmic adaptor subunit [Luteimonas sp.]